jgi:hypothetical protein
MLRRAGEVAKRRMSGGEWAMVGRKTRRAQRPVCFLSVHVGFEPLGRGLVCNPRSREHSYWSRSKSMARVEPRLKTGAISRKMQMHVARAEFFALPFARSPIRCFAHSPYRLTPEPFLHLCHLRL